MLANVGWIEWCVIGLIAFLIFGTRLPKVARAVGAMKFQFFEGARNGLKEDNDTPPAP